MPTDLDTDAAPRLPSTIYLLNSPEGLVLNFRYGYATDRDSLERLAISHYWGDLTNHVMGELTLKVDIPNRTLTILDNAIREPFVYDILVYDLQVKR